MSLVLQSSGGGSVTLQEAVTASNLTITVPATTGTMALTSQLPVDGPAFSATKGSSPTQTVSNATNTKIQFLTEEFDTNNCYDNSTNYRFTPNVAGYYQVNLAIGDGTGGGGYSYARIYKNGSSFKSSLITQTANGPSSQVSALIYLNGSTDYIEGYWFQASGGSQDVTNGSEISFFQASMVRGA
jgi:hypothetical protein